jgi:hypothetical protein
MGGGKYSKVYGLRWQISEWFADRFVRLVVRLRIIVGLVASQDLGCVI